MILIGKGGNRMSQNIYPVKLLGTFFKGYSKPQHILFSDGHSYVVKFKNNSSGTRILVNEFIAGKLGQLLSLPIIPFEIVQISDDFLKESQLVNNHKFTSGSQFASLFIDHCIQLSRDSNNEHVKVTNQEHLALMIAFDLWIGNTDRKENNVLLQPAENGQYYLHMIDHGRCFSKALWTVKDLKKMPKMEVKLNVHQWSASFLQGNHELKAAIEKIIAIPEAAIREVIQSIPTDWEVSEVEREAVVNHLLNGRKLLPGLSFQSKKKKK